MKKMFAGFMVCMIMFGGLKLIVLEPDKPHTFVITVPSFNRVVELLDDIRQKADTLAKDFEIESISDSDYYLE